ncbi:deSI-like protein At4g17486 isoform X1 [Actinidia eriantha]|uniref:deSI-like protein At4g17486 isoform X1 n=1 Tax=Actinidia eriantha TaxID=165200 RepID=UPI00258937B9|nr:deSI-like protein At4g17486 isoform X1 [Actinidia eriantha]XP_057496240.1 deSI-like protein At4g17486 isoform X1 [Actinidia eriantha]XP_057496241.1 deSI-like protein At4g17486 isoform X1 [Actinidia eriantha]XP_057496242.1 deSI-like protein At4g17486 isoform X1 [Actinidia eriantha]
MKPRPKKGWRSTMPLTSRDESMTNPVYLNVYDLTPMNGCFYWAGLGVFHTGMEVHGIEYAFGAHDYPTSGVFAVEPRQCPVYKFRKSIFIGTTYLDPIEVREFMEHESLKYKGDAYHLIAKNCNHFCDDICYRLTGNRIPKWVNRLAKIGSFCFCIFPNSEAFKASYVRHDPTSQCRDCEKKRLRSSFNCLSSFSIHQRKREREREASISSLCLQSHYKGFLPP